jgi:transposase
MLSYKFRLYPTPEQIKVLNNTIETCRRLYNDSLNERSVDRGTGFWQQKQLLTLGKPDNKYYNTADDGIDEIEQKPIQNAAG